MSLPSGISTCTVTVGSALDFFGTDASITATVTPVLSGSSKELVWSATGQALLPFSAPYAADVGAQASFQLPHVNQSGFIDNTGQSVTMWAYKVDVSVARSGTTTVYTKNVQPLVGQNVVDLDLVPDGSITSQLSAPIPPVISVNGQTGVVVIAGGGGGSVTSVAGRTGDVVLAKSDVALSNVDNTSDVNKPVSTAQQTALNLKANDASTVHTSGAESIAGAKTFTGSVVVPTPTAGGNPTTKTYVDAVAVTPPDASPTVKGIVQLAGALGGTATAPTTPTAVHVTGAESVSGVKTFGAFPVGPSANPTTALQLAHKQYVDAAVAAGAGTVPDASPTVKGIVQLAGDLSGTATSPTVPALSTKATDSAVVHNTGAESVAGIKTFTAFPLLPSSAPTSSFQVTHKSYVDTAVAGVSAAAARGQYLTVGSSLLTSGARAACDYQCDGTDDQVEINQALLRASRPGDGFGGEGYIGVALVGPQFFVGNNNAAGGGGAIVMYPSTHLAGAGWGTMITPSWPSNVDRGCIELLAPDVAHCSVSDLMIGKTNAVVFNGHGIKFVGSGGGSAYEIKSANDAYITIENVQVHFAGLRGISVETSVPNTGGIRGTRLVKCLAWNPTQEGIYTNGSSDFKVYGCHAVGSTAAFACFVLGGGSSKASDCKTYYGDGIGYNCTSSRVSLTNCEAQDSGSNGFVFSGGDQTIANCVADSCQRVSQSGAGFLISSTGTYVGLDAFERGQTPSSPQTKSFEFQGAPRVMVMGRSKLGVSGGAHITPTSGTVVNPNSYVRIIRDGLNAGDQLAPFAVGT